MNPERVTSLSLLERARHHDEPSWRRLVTLYGPLIEHWCRRGGARPEDAADLAQEIFLAVAQGLERFERRGPGSFRGWVRGITRHKLLDSYRRAERKAAAAGGSTALQRLQEIPDPQPGSDEDADEMSGLYRRAPGPGPGGVGGGGRRAALVAPGRGGGGAGARRATGGA